MDSSFKNIKIAIQEITERVYFFLYIFSHMKALILAPTATMHERCECNTFSQGNG